MGKIKLFPTAESGKSVALISLILEQYRGVFEKIYIFSPSVNIDDGWIPVKKYIEQDLGVNTEKEQAYWDEWDKAEMSKKLEMKKLYQVLSHRRPGHALHQRQAHANKHLGG